MFNKTSSRGLQSYGWGSSDTDPLSALNCICQQSIWSPKGTHITLYSLVHHQAGLRDFVIDTTQVDDSNQYYQRRFSWVNV